MTTVNTEGKPDWLLSLEYGLRTIITYAQLGASLGALQARHLTVPLRLALYNVRDSLKHDGVASDDSDIDTIVHRERGWKANLSLLPRTCTCTTPSALLLRLLQSFSDIASITHAEAVDERVIQMFRRQVAYLQEQRRLQEIYLPPSATTAKDCSSDVTTAKGIKGDVVFQLAESDSAYSSLLAAGRPIAITYGCYITLVSLLSEALAWDYLWMYQATASECDAASRGGGSGDGCTRGTPPSAIEASGVALMLPNSVEYNALWMAASRSGPLQTFLCLLYSAPSPKPLLATYRPCQTALLNTNIPSNAMLYHALESAGSTTIIIDEAYLHLLFLSSTAGEQQNCKEAKDSAELRADASALSTSPPSNTATTTFSTTTLRLPPCVRRVYLWRTTNAVREPSGSRKNMIIQLNAFNARAYQASGVRTDPSSSSTWTPPPSPPLDLFDVIRDYYEVTPSETEESIRKETTSRKRRGRTNRSCPHVTHQQRAKHFPLLTNAIQAAPTTPPSLKRLDHLSEERQARQQQYKAALHQQVMEALQRFTPTQPLLFIFTSGTTGLPKPARFSHLRFFATGLLSRVLSYRRKIASTLMEQQAQIQYAADRQARADLQAKAPLLSQVESSSCSGAALVPPSKNMQPDWSVCPTAPLAFGAPSPEGVVPRRRFGVAAAIIAAILRIVWWCFGLLFRAAGAQYILDVAADHLLYTAAQRELIEAERSRIAIYNCLPMYHTVGSVFCLGHLIHGLEEQQAAWATLRRCATLSTRLPRAVPTVCMVLRTKFSASQMRNDLQRYRVTVVQYIGEVLRYAMLYEQSHAYLRYVYCPSPATASGRVNEDEVLALVNRTTWRVPYAFGNGLRRDVWVDVMQRLNIAQPVEFYSATEGNIFLLNLYGMPGIIGHIPRFFPPLQWLSMQYFPLFPFRVLRYDADAQAVWRNPTTGYAAHAAVGEVGEAVGEIISGVDIFGLRRFDGYHIAAPSSPASVASCAGETAKSAAAKEQKIIRHVLWPFRNDSYFLSGDLIQLDRFGFCTFVDRVGDTYRWKGENVSTEEVARVLQSIKTVASAVAVVEAVVYGVQLPGRDGRAGMALLRLQARQQRAGQQSHCKAVPQLTLREERLFLQNELYHLLSGGPDGGNAVLPSYAIPLFIRIEEFNMADEDEAEQQASTEELLKGGKSNLQHTTATDDETPAQTSTFKYKRGLLVKAGYDFPNSSATCDAADANGGTAWGALACDGDEDSVEDDAGHCHGSGNTSTTSTSFTRVYILVTNPATYKKIALQPRSTKEVSEVAVDLSGSRGYLPLTPKTWRLIGGPFDQSGW